MKTISISGSLSTGLDSQLSRAATIELEDVPLGQGGFGIAYRALSIDWRPVPPQVVKLLTASDAAIARHGLETVRELQRRLHAANARLLMSGGSGLLASFPALLGVPQLSFEGRLEGKPVLGYTANDLTRAGFDEMGHILDDETKTRTFQSIPLFAKLRIAAQLVSAFEFLSSEIRFIHADMKAEALFIDVLRLRCAIIDFDSGALARDAADTPTTFGTRQDWLAPEIVRQLDATGNTNRVVQVNLLSDVWSINVALHYVFFGCHPLFFLSEISERSIDAYFRRFQWPDADPGFVYFRREYATAYRQYVAALKQRIPTEIVQRFAFTINQGFRNPASRTTYGQWKTVLRSANRPSIRRFSADRTFVSDRRPVQVSWDVTGASRVELRGIGDVTGKSFVDLTVRRDTDLELVVTPDSGAAITRRIRIEVDKRAPVISRFETSSSMMVAPVPARLSWQVTGAERIEIQPGIGDVSGRSELEVLPRCDTQYTLTATSAFGVTAKETIAIRVSQDPPAIAFFRCESPYLTNGEPARLSWQVLNDPETVVLQGVGPVAHSGSVALNQDRNTEYVLTATSFFGRSVSARRLVLVSTAPPVLKEFRCKPSIVREGMDATLTWDVTGAARVFLEPHVGVVPASGRCVIRVPADQQIVLRAESHYGLSASRTLNVKVTRLTTRGPGQPAAATVGSRARTARRELTPRWRDSSAASRTELGAGTRTKRQAAKPRR